MKIDDGKGSGIQAEVDKKGRLVTSSVNQEQQHDISVNDQEAYQISADLVIATTEQELLLLKNTSDKNMIITFIRVESIGAAVASTAAYFNLKIGGAYVSGGTAITPINMFSGSANDATGDFYDGSVAIVTDTNELEIDRVYEANKQVTYNKHGSLIIPKNSVFIVSHKGSTVAGNAYTRVSFYYE